MRFLQLMILGVVLLGGCQPSGTEMDVLRERIGQLVVDRDAVVGVSIIGPNSKDTLSLQGDRRMPMQSVFKFHIALAVLAAVDQGNLSLDQQVAVSKDELLPALWSPLRDENPDGGSFTIARLIQYAVSQSDNVSCDVLMRLAGGPKAVEAYFKQHGIRDIEITFNEEDMQAEWEHMFQNWTTPKAASEILKMFYDNQNGLLSAESHEFIWKTMKETSTGEDRLKGLLPEGTVVAHKTGYSGKNKEGITGAYNDIGVVFLPGGEHVIISVFVGGSKEDNETNAKIIADIAKATYDFYTIDTK